MVALLFFGFPPPLGPLGPPGPPGPLPGPLPGGPPGPGPKPLPGALAIRLPYLCFKLCSLSAVVIQPSPPVPPQ